MQMQLPIFPRQTKLISASWGLLEKDDMVYYLHNGDPVYTHHKNDINTFRFVTASLIVNYSCRASDLSKVLGFSVRNLNRYAKRLRSEGTSSFFNPVDNRGKCYKMTSEKLKKAQELLDNELSNVKIARIIGVNEASVRYHLKQGTLKKSPKMK